MKKISLYISAIALATLGLTSCADNWETPPMDVPTEGADIEATLTIAELKAMYWQDVNSYGTPVTKLADGRNAVIKGTIVSSTEAGNIYKSVYVQDSTGAICIGIDTAKVNAVLPMGVGVAIDVTGLQIGRYSGAMQLGKADGSTVNRITYKELKSHVALDFWSSKMDTTVVTLATLQAMIRQNAQQAIREMGGRLVRINGVQFQEAGQAYAPGATTSRHITDSLGNSIIVYNSSYADFAYDTMPYGTGDVVGILSNYNNQWQLLLIDINGVIDFDGEGTPDEEKPAPDLPEGVLTVNQALEIISSGNIPTEAVQVMGRIVSIDNIDTSYGNATYTIMDQGATKGLIIYRGYWLNGAKFTSENQIKVGEYIIVSGVLVNYNGTTPEMTSGSQVVTYFGDPDDTPTNPTPTPDAPEGVISVAQALNLINSGYSGAAQVKGFITKIDEIDTTGNFGNATYYIGDTKDATTTLEVYRGYGLGGEKFNAPGATLIKVGDEVIVDGTITLFYSTPEFNQGSTIISLNGQTAGGGNSGGNTPGGDVIFSETFSSSQGAFTIENVTINEALSYVWTFDSSYGMKASAFVNNTSYASDSWLISPVIALTDDANLTFDHVVNKFPTLDIAKSMVSVAIREENGQWQTVTVPTWSTNTDWTFVNSGAISLSSYVGKNIQIGFHYTSQDGTSGTWEVKNVLVTKK